jgi:hypothetical protein
MDSTKNNSKARFFVGWAVADITPSKPVALVGQLFKRISEKVQDPLNATVLALETRDEKGNREQAIMVSCDLLFIRAQTQKKLQALIAGKLSGFDSSKLFLNAIHSHTSPGVIDDEFYDLYDIGRDEGVMKPSEFEAYFIEKVSEKIIEAWNNRKPGGFSWGLGNAVLGHNRRTVKFDGTAKMYGVDEPDFSHYEGTDDNRVQMLFFYDENKSLTGMIINSTATAQVTDDTNFISADFYSEVRQNIKKKYGENVNVFFQLSAAGDITPVNHEYIYKQAEEAMLAKKGITARQELANRMFNAVNEVFPFVKDDISYQVVFKHAVAKINLPVHHPQNLPFYITDDVNPAEIHVIRLSDIALATNPFELFIDYGNLIKARSRAIITFIVEMSCQHSGYLPTERAVKGGGYSADKYLVGPEGGAVLVDKTVKLINEMWRK